MPRGKRKPKDTGQQDTPIEERKAGAEIDEAHEEGVLANLSPTIHAGFTRLYEIEAELAAKTVKHLDPVRQERKEAWAALREETGMQREELAPYFAIFKRARDLDEFDDQSAAAVLKDKMRRLYQALPAGETMNFLDAINGEAMVATSEAPRSAKREGYQAFAEGMRFDQCPFKDAVNREAWQQGFHDAQSTFSKDAPPKAPSDPPDEATQH